MGIETLCPPPEDLQNQLKTVGTIKAKFGIPIETSQRIGEEGDQRVISRIELNGNIAGLGIIKLEASPFRIPQLSEIPINPVEKIKPPRKIVAKLNPQELRSLRTEITQLLKTSPQPESIEKPLPAPTPISKKVDIENKMLGEFGFDVDKEVKGLHDKYVAGLAEGLSPAEAKTKPIKETMANSKDVHGEYALGLPVLPQRIVMKDGQLLNSKSGYRIAGMITEEERQGAVLEGWLIAEDKLATAKKGDVFIMISPPGKTGLHHSETNEEHVYEDMQMYVVIVGDNGELRGVTYIVSHIAYQQVLKLYSQFQAPTEKMTNMKLSELERTSEMVRQPIFISGGKLDHYKILDKTQAVVGREVMRSYDGKEKTFTEARGLLGKLDHLEFLPEKCKPDLDDLRKYLDKQVESIQDPKVYEAIKARIRWTYLRIAEKILGFDEKKNVVQVQAETKAYKQAMDTSNISSIDNKYLNVMFAQTQAALALIPGCLGNKKAGSSLSLTGQTVGDLLSSNIISFPGSGGISLNGEVAKCSTCNLELCEGKCYNCEKSSQQDEKAQEQEEEYYQKAA